jgi:hypothetical protein
MVLSQEDLKITLDQTLKTTHIYVCGVTMLPSYDSKGVVIDITAREHVVLHLEGSQNRTTLLTNRLEDLTYCQHDPTTPLTNRLEVLTYCQHDPKFILQNLVFMYRIVIQMSNNTLPHIP